MQARIERQRVYELRPELPRALLKLSEAAASTLDRPLLHLVKIRCSQINGCAFCLNMHMTEARHDGEKQHRLDTLSAWRETAWFSDRERAALQFSELLTRLPVTGAHEELIDDLMPHFSEQQIVDLTAVIIVINGWNRVVAAMGFQPEEQ